MKDLVERQAVTDLIMENDPWWGVGMTRTIFDGINRLPSVDAVPVRHGKWGTRTVTNASNGTYTMNRCSECGLTIIDRYKYCPNCGARMDKE